MGHKHAWEALTAPKPTDLQVTVVFVAERCLARFPYKNRSHEEDVSWVIAVLLRWGWFTTGKRVDMGRMAYGRLVSDCMSAWDILLERDVPYHGSTDKRQYHAIRKQFYNNGNSEDNGNN